MSASTASQAFRPIFKEEIEDSSDKWAEIQWKGAKRINEPSVKRKDDLVVDAGTKAHKSCCQYCIHDKSIKSHVAKKSSGSVSLKRSTRQSSGSFDSEKVCVIC